jgi:steroid delta-isomerase-like uncharacterized protein
MATTEADNKELVRDFHRRILTEHDLNAATDLLAENYVEHNPVLPDGEVRGRENMVGFWRDMFGALPDVSISEQEIICEGNIVASRTIAHGTHDGEFMGLEPTGNNFEVPGMDFYCIEDGKITETWVCVDSLGMMEQLGAMEP